MRHICSIYSRSIRKVKIKYFLLWKYKANLILSNDYLEWKKKSNVHERLFNDYKCKEEKIISLTKRYEDIECEKYTFIPNINKTSLKYLNNNNINNVSISIKKDNQDYFEYFKNKAFNDKNTNLKGIKPSQPTQLNNYIIQSYHSKQSDNLTPNNCFNLKNNKNKIIEKHNQTYNVGQSQNYLNFSQQPQTSKITPHNNQSKFNIHDLINDSNNNNVYPNNFSSVNLNMFYKQQNLFNSNNKKASKINLNSSSSSLSLLSTQNKTKRHSNSFSSNTFLINSTTPTPTTRITKNNYAQSIHNPKSTGYYGNIVNTSLSENIFIGKSPYQTIIQPQDNSISNTIRTNKTKNNTQFMNNMSSLFTNRLNNKNNILTERTVSKSMLNKNKKPNENTHTIKEKSNVHKYRKNVPVGTNNLLGGYDEKKTHYHSQSSSTTNFEITKNNKRERRNNQNNYINSNHNNISRSITTNNNILSSKELFFSNGNNHFSNDNNNTQNQNITNSKQQQNSVNTMNNYVSLYTNKFVSPKDNNKSNYGINEQQSFSYVNNKNNCNKSNSKLKISSGEINESVYNSTNSKKYNENYLGNSKGADNSNNNLVTLQSLSDSKIYEIANHYITTDESLDKYQCMSGSKKKGKQ